MMATNRLYSRDSDRIAVRLNTIEWRKSTYSGSQGNCIQAAPLGPASWRKSSHSGNDGNCVELADQLAGVAVRDSKDPGGVKLVFMVPSWRHFIEALKADLPQPP